MRHERRLGYETKGRRPQRTSLVWSGLVWSRLVWSGPIAKPRSRWEDNIRIYPKEIGVNTRNCIESAQDRNFWRVLGNAALNLWVPYVMVFVY